jgi:hypothetical protein
MTQALPNTITDPFFGTLTDALAKYGAPGLLYQCFLPDTALPSPLRVTVQLRDGQIHRAQQEFFALFLNEKHQMIETVLEAVALYYEDNLEIWNENNQQVAEGQQWPAITTVGEILPFLHQPELHLGPPNADGVCLVGFIFECDWDKTAGIGVILEGGYVAEVGVAQLVLQRSQP